MQMKHELLLLPSISDEGCLACVQFSLTLRTAEVVTSPPAFLMHTVSECGSGCSGQKANGTLIKDRAGTPSMSLPRSFSVQRFILWLDAPHSQRKKIWGHLGRRKRGRIWRHNGLTSHMGTLAVGDPFSSSVRRMRLRTKEESRARRSLGLEMSFWRRLWLFLPRGCCK